MSDAFDPQSAQERGEININEAQEVQYWTERFAVSEMALRQAVANVGAAPEAVGQHLGFP